MIPKDLRELAEELAEYNGCVDVNPCWEECVEISERDIQRGKDV